jgi:selenocysteine lyase/cysteine desulfurase
MTLDRLRDLFPITRRWAYLDHASIGPVPTPAYDAVQAHLRTRHLEEPNTFPQDEPALALLRAKIGDLIGAEAARVEFAPNTSYALNVLAQGFPWKRGDRIAIPEMEFPANVYPFLALKARGVEIDFIRCTDGQFTLDDVEAALTPRTRLVAVSWVQFLSGFRCDVEAISALAHDRGALLSLDAIQGLGALRLDVRAAGVDFLACGAHKWLMAMPGTGFLYASEEMQAVLAPTPGWLNGPIDWDDLRAAQDEAPLHDDASRFRVGTLNVPGLLSLDATLGLLGSLDPIESEARVLAMRRRLADGLDNLGLQRFGTWSPENDSGIVTVQPDNPEPLAEALEAAGVRVALRDRKIRLSPHLYTHPDEVDRALGVLRDALHDRRDYAARDRQAVYRLRHQPEPLPADPPPLAPPPRPPTSIDAVIDAGRLLDSDAPDDPITA